MRCLLFGRSGQLGWELRRALASLGEVITLDYPEIDLTQEESYLPRLRQLRPQVVINATAYTAVDRAESEPEPAFAVNAQAPGKMAQACAEMGAALIHYSTDYVFDGSLGRPYTEADAPHPLSVYGQSKLEGEQAIQAHDLPYLILRTSWVYTTRRDSFVTKVLQWARRQKQLHLVTDQVSNPTWARQLAEITACLLARAGDAPTAWLGERRGVYHLGGDGYASRLEWGREILRLDPLSQEQQVQEILPALTADFPTPAQRPLYSALNCERFTQTFGLRLPAWQTALALAMEPQ